jgi:hypothetical protein
MSIYVKSLAAVAVTLAAATFAMGRGHGGGGGGHPGGGGGFHVGSRGGHWGGRVGNRGFNGGGKKGFRAAGRAARHSGWHRNFTYSRWDRRFGRWMYWHPGYHRWYRYVVADTEYVPVDDGDDLGPPTSADDTDGDGNE